MLKMQPLLLRISPFGGVLVFFARYRKVARRNVKMLEIQELVDTGLRTVWRGCGRQRFEYGITDGIYSSRCS